MYISDLYEHTGELLGNGAYASVQTYRNIGNNKEYAVKVSQSIIATDKRGYPHNIFLISR